MIPVKIVAALAAALALMPALARADGPYSADGVRIRPVFSKELPNVPGKTLTAVEVDYAPGGASRPHHHAGVVLAYVVSGEIRSQVDDAPPRVFHAGESFFEAPGAHHMVSENASKTQPARLLAVIVAENGATLTAADPAPR